MKRMIFVRDTGTPAFRAALESPPAAKIQLPNRVRVSSQVAPSVMTIHQTTETRNLYGSQKSRGEHGPGAVETGALVDSGDPDGAGHAPS